MSCRCSSCGYIHEYNDTDRPVLDDELIAVAVAAIPAVVQQSRCPLCGELFDAPEEYTGHRERNCAPAPQVDPPADAGDPVATNLNPDPPAPQE
jgi:hypothetical protein